MPAVVKYHRDHASHLISMPLKDEDNAISYSHQDQKYSAVIMRNRVMNSCADFASPF